jgi:hypothetical protein
MVLKLIGAGLGRTGTTSLKSALEQLGIGRCYHMQEVFPDPEAPARWVRAAEGNVDWEDVFRGYTATVDWPGCTFWRELCDLYPDAKVLLSVRDPNKWFDSTQATIFANETDERLSNQNADFDLMFDKVVRSMFDGKLHDRAHCISVFERHNAEVIKTIPKDRLLVYEASQGWAPLCRFLGVPVPAAPFPKSNTTEDFHSRHPRDATEAS